MAADDLAALDAFAADLIAKLEPGARRELAAALAKELRASQQRRIAAQQNPDGSAYAPRKPQLRHQQGRIRRAMFSKLRTARFLKARGTADAAIVGFTEQVSRIARVHQGGLRDYVNRRTGLEVDYPKRELLGYSEQDLARIAEIVVAHLARA